MNRTTKIICLILAALMVIGILLIPVVSLADAGGFSGDSDYGGGSSDWGGSSGSSDWGSSSGWGGGGFIFSGGDGDNNGSGAGGGLIFWLVLIAIIYIVIRSRMKKGGGAAVAPGATPLQLKGTIAELKEVDPDFSEDAIREKIGNLYTQMQAAWQDKKWDPMRAHMTDALYNQLLHQLEAMANLKRTNYIERIAVLGVDLTGYGQDEKNDILTATLRTRIVDYTVDDATGKIVSGSNAKEKFMTYQWVLIRSKGVKTRAAEGNHHVNCPNCSAPLDLNHSAKCAYCGTVVTASEYDWVISAIKGIAQHTAN